MSLNFCRKDNAIINICADIFRRAVRYETLQNASPLSQKKKRETLFAVNSGRLP